MGTLTTHLAKHLGDVHIDGNWATSNLKDLLTEVTWQQATTRVGTLNTIAALTFHINYYVEALLGVLQGKPLTARDAHSFDMPEITSREAWESLVTKALADGEEFSRLVEALPDEKMWETFVDKKYGNYYRNLQGLLEHTQYHLGQIAVIKKLSETH